MIKRNKIKLRTFKSLLQKDFGKKKIKKNSTTKFHMGSTKKRKTKLKNSTRLMCVYGQPIFLFNRDDLFAGLSVPL